MCYKLAKDIRIYSKLESARVHQQDPKRENGPVYKVLPIDTSSPVSPYSKQRVLLSPDEGIEGTLFFSEAVPVYIIQHF